MVYIVATGVSEKLALSFLEQGFMIVETKTPYELLRLKKDKTTLVLYTSKKLVAQTPQENYEVLRKEFLRKGLLLQAQKEKPVQKIRTHYTAIIGSDEALKGDTFGGMVVVSAYFTKKEENKLIDLGVKDSKLLSDTKIKQIAQQLLTHYKNRFSITNLTAKEYNQHIQQQGSVTALLNYYHQKTAQQLQQSFGINIPHIVDKYPGCTVGDEQVFKAESLYVVVAAASIISRYYGLLQFEELSSQLGFRVPKGSTHVQEALNFLKKQKKDFNLYTKVHFKNVKNVIHAQKQAVSKMM